MKYKFKNNFGEFKEQATFFESCIAKVSVSTRGDA